MFFSHARTVAIGVTMATDMVSTKLGFTTTELGGVVAILILIILVLVAVTTVAVALAVALLAVTLAVALLAVVLAFACLRVDMGVEMECRSGG
jgi:hypothetical protein